MRSFDARKAEIARDYESASPLGIVLQAAEAHADEIEGRHRGPMTVAEGQGIRAAAARLRAPANVDVPLLREQRDWLLSLRADSPAELGRMVKAGAQHLDGIVNLLDAMLDSQEGYVASLEPVSRGFGEIHGLPGEPEAGEIVVLRWTASYHVPNVFVGKPARFVRKTSRGLYVVALCSEPARELRVRRRHLQRS